MKENELISFILPIYNKEDVLRRCLLSLQSQTYSNFEALLIDDGSTDNSVQIAKEFALRDKRFVYLYQENAGPSAARNNGLLHAKGTWISFVDPDDYIEPNMIESLYMESEQNDIVCCCCIAECGDDKFINSFFLGNLRFKNIREDQIHLVMSLMDANIYNKSNITGIGVPWGKLYRLSFLKNNNLFFDIALKRMQDNIFNMQAFFAAEGISYIDIPLYHYDCSNIMSIGFKYDTNTPSYYAKVIKIRREFLIRYDLFGLREIYKAFCREVFSILEMTMSRYFFNRNNEVRNLVEFKHYIENNDILKYIRCLSISDVKGIKKKIKLFLIKHKAYRMLDIIYGKVM